MVLALAGPEPGELAPPELEMLSRSLMGTLLRLARERDVGAQVGGSRGIQGQVEEWEGCRDPAVWGRWGWRRPRCGVGVGPAWLRAPDSACGGWGQM